MKNIKKKLFLALQFTATFVLLLSLPFLCVSLLLWASSGFEKDFFAIDSCLDSGGAWNEATRQCEK